MILMFLYSGEFPTVSMNLSFMTSKRYMVYKRRKKSKGKSIEGEVRGVCSGLYESKIT